MELRAQGRAALGALIAVILSLAVLGGSAAATKPKPKPDTAAPGAPASDDAVIAIVGSRKILRSDFETRVERAQSEFRATYGTDVPEEMNSLFRRQVLTGLINLQLLVLEAQRRGITATAAEADEILKRNAFFNPGGKFDAEKFAATKAANSPTYQQTIAELRLELAGQKLQTRLQNEHTPSDSLLREVAVRSIGQADIDYFLVDSRLFDGHFPEPRETDIQSYYRSHTDEFRRAQRAVLSVIFVDQPSLTDSIRTLPGGVRSWDARLEQRADSAIAALKSGSPFQQVASHFSGHRDGEVVLRDNFPGYWLGSSDQKDQVFRAPPGAFLPAPVASNPGYLVVRVDSVTAGGAIPLSEISSEIRRRLRVDARAHREDREFAALYARYGDSLSTPAVRVRYASADTGAMDPGEPSAADLDRYFRGHMADYSTYDARTSTIRTSTLDDVQGDVRRRWRFDRRAEMARALAEGIQRAWAAGRRDPDLEKQATLLRDVGPLPVGSPIDTGLVARAVADSLRMRGATTGVGTSRYARGEIVFWFYEATPHYRPTLDQARPQLADLADKQRAETDRAGAKELFDRDPSAWKRGRVMHFSRFMVPELDLVNVPLTRAEIERYRRDHAGDYSAPELIHARHILISPTGPGDGPDRIARARIDSLARVIRAGADFSTVARQVTDDPATQASGGDLGTFGHGAMLPSFEKAAFKLRPGQISEPVRTREGYHLIQCVEYWPLEERPLDWIYTEVGTDAARDKADSLCFRRADSLYRATKTPARAVAAAKHFGWFIESNHHVIGDHVATTELKPYLIALENVAPGQMYPGVQQMRAFGYAITWVDSISEPETPTWDEASDRVIDQYRRDASGRAVRAKLAELDSLAAAGWSFDSLATLWGGKVSQLSMRPADGLPDMPGARTALDSLVFGGRLGPPLKPGEVSGWVRVPYGFLKLRLDHRLDATEADIARRMTADRRASLERSLKPVFDDMGNRYGVQILDSELRAVTMPPLPPGPPELP